MSRNTRTEYRANLVGTRPKRMSVTEAITQLKQEITRRMIADGLIPKKQPHRYRWETADHQQGGIVTGFCKPHARGEIKKQMQVSKLPKGLIIERLVDATTSSESGSVAASAA